MRAENAAALDPAPAAAGTGSDAPLLVTLLLDESGSMAAIKDGTIGGYNAYVGTLRALPTLVRFSLLKFDSNRVEKVHVGTSVAEVPDMAPEDFRPGAATPLVDAAMTAIEATEGLAAETPEARVVVAIQTDGHENCSNRYRQADLLAKVKEKTAAGWQFVYLGANIDAYAAAHSYGLAGANTVSYAGGSSGLMFQSLGENTAAYASGASASMRFTAEQKEAAGGELHWQGGDGFAAAGAVRGGTAEATPPAPSLVDAIDLAAGDVARTGP